MLNSNINRNLSIFSMFFSMFFYGTIFVQLIYYSVLGIDSASGSNFYKDSSDLDSVVSALYIMCALFIVSVFFGVCKGYEKSKTIYESYLLFLITMATFLFASLAWVINDGYLFGQAADTATQYVSLISNALFFGLALFFFLRYCKYKQAEVLSLFGIKSSPSSALTQEQGPFSNNNGTGQIPSGFTPFSGTGHSLV